MNLFELYKAAPQLPYFPQYCAEHGRVCLFPRARALKDQSPGNVALAEWQARGIQVERPRLHTRETFNYAGWPPTIVSAGEGTVPDTRPVNLEFNVDPPEFVSNLKLNEELLRGSRGRWRIRSG